MPVPVDAPAPLSVELSLAVPPTVMIAADKVVPMVGDALVTVSCSLVPAVHGLEVPLLLASPL